MKPITWWMGGVNSMDCRQGGLCDYGTHDPLPEPEIGHFAYLESHDYRMLQHLRCAFLCIFRPGKAIP